MLGFYEDPNIFGMEFSNNSTALIAGNQINGVLKKVIDNWNDFKIATGAIVFPIQPDHGKLVMDAYFDGGTPFNSIKNRADIPDAFIYFGIKELLKGSEQLVFVTNDKKFSKAIKDKTILCFDSISELFLVGPAKLDGQYFNCLNSNDRGVLLLRMYKEDIDKKLALEIAVSEVIDIIGEDSIDLAIGKYNDYSVDVIDLKHTVNDIKHISSSSLLIPFTANIICTINSTASKEELSSIDGQRLERIEKEIDEDGDFQLNEKYQSSISGHFSITFEDTDPSTWMEEKPTDHFWSEPEIKEIGVALEDLRASAVAK